MPTSKNYLLDVNCWLAAAARRHSHHSSAKAWFDAADGRLAFCRVTQMAFLRLVTNPKVLGADVLTAQQGWVAYRKFQNDSRVVFVEEPTGLEKAWSELTDKAEFKQNLWTDSYLAAFAKTGEFTIVSFDVGFQKFPGLDVTILQSVSEPGRHV